MFAQFVQLTTVALLCVLLSSSCTDDPPPDGGLRTAERALGDSGEDSPSDGEADGLDGGVTAGELPLGIELPPGMELAEVVHVELQRAAEGTPFVEAEGECPISPASDAEPSVDVPPVPEWQDPKYDNDRVMGAVEDWKAARSDPSGHLTDVEQSESDAMWRPASPEELAHAAAQPADEPPAELVAAYEAYVAWISAHPDATVDERVAVKASLFAEREEWR